MTINYTTLLGLAKPVTGTETGQWGDVVNDEITSLLEDAVANAATFSVTVGDVTLSTTNGASNQARMSTLIITGSPGILRNVIVPSQAKIYVVINQANAEVVIKGAATTGVTVGAGQTAQIAWNGSDFVEIGNYVHGNFVVNGNLSVNGNSTLGDGGADTTTINGQFIGANSNISKATTVSTSAPALAWVKGATYTDTASSGGTTQAHAPFTLLSAPTLATSNIVTYTNASTFYIAGAPSASGSATITNPYAMYVAAGEAYLAGAVTMAATTQNLALGTSQTSGTWTAGGAAQTGALTLDQSTKTHTLNLGTGATESAATKTVNIGTAGVSGSTTAVNIGSAVSGATNNVTINGNPTFNSGTANGVLYLNGSKVATSGSDLVFNATGLGIGTSSPATKLHVSNGSNSDSGDFTAFVFGGTDATNSRTASFIKGTSTPYNTIFRYQNNTGTTTGSLIFQNGSTEQMRLDSSGNLGIGTTPTRKLTIYGAGASGVSASNPSIRLDNNTTGRFALYEASGDGNLYIWNSDTGAGSTVILRGSGSGTETARFDGSGNLGIGTSSPAGKLTVKTGTNENLSVVTGGSGDMRLSALNDAGSATVQLSIQGSPLYFRGVGGAINATLDASGNLGLGVTPSAWISAYRAIDLGGTGSIYGRTDSSIEVSIAANGYRNSSGNWIYKQTAIAGQFGYDTSGAWYWKTAPSGTAGTAISFTQAMTLDASGRLAIGATSSTNPVTVVGTANAAYTSAKGIVVDHTSSSTSVVVPIGFSWSSSISNQNPYWGIGFLPTNFGAGSGDLGFYTNGSERARITSGGDLGIGTTSPGCRFNATQAASAALGAQIALHNNASTAVGNAVEIALLTDSGASPSGIRNGRIRVVNENAGNGAANMQFWTWSGTTDAERARITSGGDLLVGNTTATGSRFATYSSGTTSATYAGLFRNSAATDLFLVRSDGVIFTGTAANSPYNFTTASAANVVVTSIGELQRSTSSLKYKTDVQDATHGLAEVMQLRPVTYKGKNDGDTVFGGLIAEEVDAVGLTEFVQYAEDGSPDALAYGNMVSVLVKAIQEQQALITALTARVAALEAA